MFVCFLLNLIRRVGESFDYNKHRPRHVKLAHSSCINYAKALRTQNISLNILYARAITFELFLTLYLTDIWVTLMLIS